MAAFIIYTIRWAVVLTMLYSMYGLFLKRETLHGFNRVVLLAILVASMVLPLCQIETGRKNIVTQSREKIEYHIANVQNPLSDDIKRITITNPDNGVKYTHIPIRDDVNAYILIAIAIYLTGLVIAWGRYFWQLTALLLLMRRSKCVEVEGLPKGVRALVHPDIKTPCSWMRWMLLNPADVNVRPTIKHELAHIRLGHSWDMLLCELSCRMLWCVPFAWMLRQDLRDIHEYQADRWVLQSGINLEEYQLLLIKKATSTGLQPVVNALNQSPIKRRFKMMYRKPSRRWVALKAAYLLPLSALAIVAFARPQTLSEIEEKVETGTGSAASLVEEVTKYVATATWNNDEPAMAEQATPTVLPTIVETKDTVQAMSDANLVKADLAESGNTVLGGSAAKTATELLDSTMQAVGARKIAEGTYIGHFQPNLNSDTVRIARAAILDRKSQQTDEHLFAQNATAPYAYNVTLNAETRKGKTGYYIRYLQPANSTVRNYDKKEVDPYMLSTDSVLTKRDRRHLYSFTPAAIERSKKETRVYMYVGFRGEPPLDTWRKQGTNRYADYAIVDELTGDKYVCRATDYDYFKYAKDEVFGKDTVMFYQVCLVFPPIGKNVKQAHFGNVEKDGLHSLTFNLDEIPRKGRVITK